MHLVIENNTEKIENFKLNCPFDSKLKVKIYGWDFKEFFSKYNDDEFNIHVTTKTKEQFSEPIVDDTDSNNTKYFYPASKLTTIKALFGNNTHNKSMDDRTLFFGDIFSIKINNDLNLLYKMLPFSYVDFIIIPKSVLETKKIS